MNEPADQDRGKHMHDLIARLYPICRSITGQGVRNTLAILQEFIPLTIKALPSGTPVFDWTIPDEWNINAAHITDSTGRRIVDLKNHSLHVMSYSTPVNAEMSLAELRPHLFSLPDHPDWIPYRTSYYKKNWGFCLPHRVLEAMREDRYRVVIDSSLSSGVLNHGELLLPGGTTDEILLSAHVCHPSLANDNLAGIALLTELAMRFAKTRLRHSLRFVFAPGTIGAIAWLALNESQVGNIKHGLIVSCVGDAGSIHYKRSRRGDAAVDRAMAHVLVASKRPHEMLAFSPYGYDERQYCSPGFDLPVGLFMRSCFGQFPEYHTSADNLGFVKPAALQDSFEVLVDVIELLDRNQTFLNTNPKCEPQLGKRGAYDNAGGTPRDVEMAMFWVLNYSDGRHDLLDIAQRSGIAFESIFAASGRLSKAGLLQAVEN